MKKIIFTLLFLLAPFYGAFCQTSYYYNNQFIELIPDEYYGMNERTVQVTGNKIQFEMPYLAEGKSLIFTVSGGGVSSVHNFIFSAENTISSFDIKTNNDVKIQLVENNNIDNSKTEICIVNIYNALNQNLVERKIIKTTSETFSLSPEIYIVEAVAHGKRISRTFKIK